MATEHDILLADGRTLHAYDSFGPGRRSDEGAPGLTVFWHHGTPNTGDLPEPLLPHAARHAIRWVSHDRPGYGGSTAHPGRTIASAADDVAALAEALGIGRFAVVGHSGGGPHALACAARLPDRVLAAVSISGLAPFDAEGLDWYAGMATAGSDELHAAAAGRAALEQLLATSDFDPEQFTPSDHAALAGEWAWLGRVAGKGFANPTALLLAACTMLDYVDQRSIAAKIRRATYDSLATPAERTRDLGGQADTKTFTDAVIRRLG